jgi:hypothetical protein
MDKLIRLIIEPKRQTVINLSNMTHAELSDGALVLHFIGSEGIKVFTEENQVKALWAYISGHSIGVRCGDGEKVAVMPE